MSTRAARLVKGTFPWTRCMYGTRAVFTNRFLIIPFFPQGRFFRLVGAVRPLRPRSRPVSFHPCFYKKDAFFEPRSRDMVFSDPRMGTLRVH